jgi:hypothetical protein
MVEQDKEWLKRWIQVLWDKVESVKLNLTPLAGQPIDLEIVRREIPELWQRPATDCNNDIAKIVRDLEANLAETQGIYESRKRRRAAARSFAGLTV